MNVAFLTYAALLSESFTAMQALYPVARRILFAEQWYGALTAMEVT
jgi:hypothetical protein